MDTSTLTQAIARAEQDLIAAKHEAEKHLSFHNGRIAGLKEALEALNPPKVTKGQDAPAGAANA